jgi:predicted O-linked N-acetylglucosamine transferase (SPINDLY family)/glycosyltransferase involved in cell wall biosynthesis
MHTDCLVTVVIPCYNAASYLPGAVRSVIAQDGPCTEIIIVDDASTDDTAALAEALARDVSSIRVIRLPANFGVARARNAGLREATGKYICFLDADDEYAPGFFRTVLPRLESDNDLAAITTGVELIDCHREIHPVQMRAIVGSLPANLMTRKAVALVMGGFPDAEIFRSELAGEDICFRTALARWFNVIHREERFLRYLVKRGSHLDYFLDRSQVVNGKLVYTRPFARLAEWNRARQAYFDQVGRNCRGAIGTKKPGVPEVLAAAARHYQSGQLDLAVDCLRTALSLEPDLPEVHNNLGIVLARQGKLAEASASFQEAVRCKPDFADAHNNLGNALRTQGTLEAAVAHLRQALHVRPDYVEAHGNLGIALEALGKLDEAAAHLYKAVQYKPDYLEAVCNLGLVLWKLGRIDEALAQFQQAHRLNPADPLINTPLGILQAEKGHLAEAEASLREAIRLKPDYAVAHYNLGFVQFRLQRPAEAVFHYQQAVRLKPDYLEAQVNLGNAFKDQGRLDQALQAYRTAMELKPGAADIHDSVIVTLNYHPAYDARAIFQECRRWNQRHAEALKKLIQAHTNSRDPERRLRIAYVSPDFRDHVDSFFIIPLLSNHDHEHFEVFCYADVQRPDAFTERLRGYADVWRSTVGLTDDQVADLVRSDRIDILVDLKVHTGYNRLLVFARKPAPVQVTWLGYPGTTGLSTIDYRLTDPYLDPPGMFDAFYSEESFRLPDTFWCYDPLTDGPPVNSLPALEKGVFTFGCLNNFCKVNDGCLALWADVLQAVPQSRFLLRAPQGQTRDDILARLRQRGVVESRIEFIDRVPRHEYLRLYHRFDLGLDPTPCNGHTTSMDAFWMGVPVLTLVGKTVMGRAGWSQLCNLGLQELAAETPEQYVALAARWADQLPRLQEVRRTLRQRMEQSPLMDGKRFARSVEEAYRQMWRRWCGQ